MQVTSSADRDGAGERRSTVEEDPTSTGVVDAAERATAGMPRATEDQQPQLGPTRSRCLDAFVTALVQCGDSKPWYASTTQLQLASYDLCVACRAVPTLHLTVDGGMPGRLKTRKAAAAAAAAAGEGDGEASRVPALRPRGITWNLPIWALRGSDEAFSEVKVLIFGHGLGLANRGLNRWVDEILLPPALRELTFGQFFNRPVHRVSWPASLREITFGEGFNRPILDVIWPASLEKLIFGEGFDQPLVGARWPPSLKEIAFGDLFNQPVGAVGGGGGGGGVVSWPPGLEKLSFGARFEQEIEDVAWPSTLRDLAFSRAFQLPIEDVEWPSSLERLTLARPPGGAPLPSWPGVEVSAVWRCWWKEL